MLLLYWEFESLPFVCCFFVVLRRVVTFLWPTYFKACVYCTQPRILALPCDTLNNANDNVCTLLVV